MADRETLRTWLRRRLQETSAAVWSDATLNFYINEGLFELGQAITRAEPEFALYEDTRSLIADEDLYLLPTNCERLVEVHLSTDGTNYEQIEYRRRRDQNRIAGVGDEVDTSIQQTYSRRGQYIRIWPAPTATVASGLKIVYVPVLSLSADDEVPPIVTSLHRGIVIAAQLQAYADTAESTDKQAVQAELDRYLGLIKDNYEVDEGQDEFLTLPYNLRITAQDE